MWQVGAQFIYNLEGGTRTLRVVGTGAYMYMQVVAGLDACLVPLTCADLDLHHLGLQQHLMSQSPHCMPPLGWNLEALIHCPHYAMS